MCEVREMCMIQNVPRTTNDCVVCMPLKLNPLNIIHKERARDRHTHTHTQKSSE